jgi:PAS domain S-box-containing protein
MTYVPADEATALRDLTEQLSATTEQLYAALEGVGRERSRYYDLFELAPDGYLVTGPYGRIQEVNRAAVDMLNVHGAYVLDKPLIVYIGRDSRDKFLVALSEMRTSDHWRGTLRFLARGDKPAFDADVTVGAVPSEYHTNRQLRWIIRDVTRQREAEREVASQREQLQALAAELSMAEERERRRIATGIHDRVSQNLAAARMTLGLLRSRLPADQRPLADEVCGLLDQTIQETRTLTFELSPPILHQLGLRPALDWLAESVAQRHGLAVDVTGAAEGLPEDLRGLVYQAVRELLANAAKHAAARRVTVALADEDGVSTVTVADDGVGFDPHILTVRPEHGTTRFGLLNIRTRLSEVGGAVHVASAPGGGTRVTLVMPRREAVDDPPQQGGGSGAWNG